MRKTQSLVIISEQSLTTVSWDCLEIGRDWTTNNSSHVPFMTWPRKETGVSQAEEHLYVNFLCGSQIQHLGCSVFDSPFLF